MQTEPQRHIPSPGRVRGAFIRNGGQRPLPRPHREEPPGATGRPGTDLLRLHEVGHVAVVVHAAGVEASAGALAADAGDEAGLGLLVGGVHGADGHHAADDLQQPVAAAHLVLPQGHVQQLVPAKGAPQ